MHVLAATTIVAVMSLTTPGPGEWTPDAEMILKVEAAIRLPPDPAGLKRTLRQYNRFYAGVTQNGRRVIRGTLSWSLPPAIHIVHELGLPMQLDGGCSLVNLVYDVKLARVTSIRCNGMA